MNIFICTVHVKKKTHKKMKWITFFKPLIVTFFEQTFKLLLEHPFIPEFTHLSHMIWITFWAFHTSGANNQLINLIYNGVKSHFQKIIYSLDILF